MYEQASHSLLNEILIELKPEIGQQRLRHFYTRLGANFYAIHSLFKLLYGERDDFKAQMVSLVETLAFRYMERTPALRKSDLARERDYNWFLSQKWVGMALYCDRFADDLKGLRDNLPYLQELGINLLHVMPMLDCPPEHSDGGYAVRDFFKIDARFGDNEDIEALAATLKRRDMLLVLDVVVNHTSDEHEWAQRARQGDKKYQDYYYVFDDREIPDIYEETMPEIFPVTAPGNFTWDAEMGKWVMTVFNTYQWDLNYRNPAVLIEMIDIILFWANQGADILRLDAVAFLWKKMGSVCQNEREAHLLLQLMKDCCQVTAPGVLFIAEAIVAPSEISKYFGEDAINAKECEIAYNATLMALLWDAVATKNAALLNQGIKHLPAKLERATWLNYARCHDDIGLGFDDQRHPPRRLRSGAAPALHPRLLHRPLCRFAGARPAVRRERQDRRRAHLRFAGLAGRAGIGAGKPRCRGDRRGDQDHPAAAQRDSVVRRPAAALLRRRNRHPEQPGISRRPEQSGRLALDAPFQLRLEQGEETAADRQRRAAHFQRAEKDDRAAQGNRRLRRLRQPPTAGAGQPQPAGIQPLRPAQQPRGCW
jgi:amylosucrase